VPPKFTMVSSFAMKTLLSRLHLGVRWMLAITCVFLSIFVCFLPAVKVTGYLRDPALGNGDIHPVAWQLSKTLAPRYAAWAKARMAREHNPGSVSGTEWPLFGSVFYLQALEALQNAWQRNHGVSSVAPIDYSRDAIEAAAELITDPGQAKWVQEYWGKDYLHHADLFYRYLLISSTTIPRSVIRRIFFPPSPRFSAQIMFCTPITARCCNGLCGRSANRLSIGMACRSTTSSLIRDFRFNLRAARVTRLT